MSRFIAPFRQFFAKAVDAPFEYGEAAALMTLSTVALGRRALDYGQDGIRPNLFLMLAGDSSVARKSTCVKFAKSLIQEVDDQRIGPRDYTVEGLLRWMQDKDPVTKKGRNKVTLFAEEFGGDLARMEAYAGTMAADFCALYDGESFTKVRAKSGTITIQDPRVSLFAACAYPMMQRHLKPRDWFTGYLMRFLFVAPNPTTMRPSTPYAPPFPHPEFRATVASLKILRDDLYSSRSTHAKLQLDSQAAAYFAHVMSQLRPNATMSHITQTYLARFSVSLLKLALLYQIDLDPYSNVTPLAVQQAVQFALQVCWPSFEATYSKTAMGDFEGLFAAVYARLSSVNGAFIPRIDIAKEFFGNEGLERVVSYLKSNRLVAVANGPTGEALRLP